MRNPTGAACAELVADMLFRQRAARVHALGPRVVTEMLAQIAVTTGDYAVIEDILARYASLDELALRITGGDRMPEAPLRRVA
jgi:hypothetical protein